MTEFESMETSHYSVFIVDDDEDLVKALELKLSQEGFRVHVAGNGEEALQKIKKKVPHLILLDVNMPGLSGMEVCRILRSEEETKNLPIVMLTARDQEIDRVLGLEFGADDYVTKPFSIRELILRIKGILKRVYAKPEGAPDSIKLGCLTVNLNSHEVKVKNKSVGLTLTEFKLLMHLVESPGKVQTRDFLLDKIWEYGDDVFSRTIDTHIQRLRSKLKDAGPYIKTVRGVGYRFEV